MEKLKKELLYGLGKMDIRPHDFISDSPYEEKMIMLCKDDDSFVEGLNVCKTSNIYSYIYMERGKLSIKLETEDLDNILYAIYEDIAFEVATQYELNNRRSGEDFRRQLFAKEEELLGMINEEYAKKYHEEINEILKQYPYKDKKF